MALTYKTDQITLNAADTDFTILTATATTTLVKNITWIHDDHNTTVTLSLTKSGGTKTQIGSFSATADVPTKLWTDILPLEANDVLHLQSNHISSSDVGYCIVSYVEDTTSVAGQSVGVHTDVDITGITNGQILKWNSQATEFQPGDEAGGLDDTDDLSEGTTNLYFTNARADARIAAANVTDLSDVSSAGSGSIITSAERTKLTGIATGATANDTDANLKNRANHTGTQAASTISDFDTEVANNTAVAANTAKNTYPSADASKLAGIAAGAEVNVQSDWNATSGDALILNKPTIPSNTNISNTDLTADDNRTLDMDANSLTIDINDGDFTLRDSNAVDTYIQAASNVLTLGDSAMTVESDGVFQAKAGIEQDEANLTVLGDKGAGCEVTYMGSSATSVSQGRVYYYTGSTWTAYTPASEAPQKALLGIALGSTMEKGFLLKGFIHPDSGTLTAGSQVFGLTNSSVGTTAPTTSGHFQRILGHSISASVIHFNPSQEYIELA